MAGRQSATQNRDSLIGSEFPQDDSYIQEQEKRQVSAKASFTEKLERWWKVKVRCTPTSALGFGSLRHGPIRSRTRTEPDPTMLATNTVKDSRL